ncbi:hypothetical protein EPN44_02310 [bacterium]|nr:MAG: hypothetical protein EPN44_02310 [bacterium]
MSRSLRLPIAALLAACALIVALDAPGVGQSAPSPSPVASAAPLPLETPPATGTPIPGGTPLPVASPSAAPLPTPSPTPPPITVSPTSVDLVYHQTATIQASGIFGQVHAASSSPNVQVQGIDQGAQRVTIYGTSLGLSTVTITDDRGITASVWVRVAYQAGFPADNTEAKITGNPADAAYVRRAAATAAEAAAVNLRPGAKVIVHPEHVRGARDLPLDDLETVQVPVTINGDPYIQVSGTTQVRVENFAQPRIKPVSLLVSDYPETITENGVLFSEDLTTNRPARFLYYHYNKPGSQDRRILLKVTNVSSQPAQVQYISGAAGPTPYEMEVGHLSTMRFLVHEARNEGTVVTVPPNATINLANQEFPAGTVISNLLQLRELSGDRLHLSLLVQDFGQPVDAAPASSDLLQSTVKHARGVYPIPEFFFDYTYFVGSDDVEVPIGQIPLPNLRRGEALGGDYGVLQSITLTLVNRTGAPARLALYQNPRGGAATATYIIDGTVVLSHPAKAFTTFKVRQYAVPAHGFVRTQVVTMPEGGSSYPLRLVVGPDDGSVAPGAPGSPIH